MSDVIPFASPTGDQPVHGKRWLSLLEVTTEYPIGRTSVYEAMRSGRLRARKSGRRTVFDRLEVDRFFAELPERDPSPA